MATEIDRITSLQAIADSTGLIYDRAMQPEKVVGQAWLISRGRVVTLASSVSNYAEAPWALLIKFPHPNLSYAVRTVTLHPDFNRREARDYYLAQASGPLPPAMFENDIATLALDSDLTPPEPEKVQEVNRALALPFEISSQDMSGSMRGGDFAQILQSAISTGRSGLLTIVDQRHMPFARISIRQARVARAHFELLQNEIALCELLWRRPPGYFAFRPVDNYPWPADVPEMVTPLDAVFAEANRRAEELPRVIEMLGGPDTRFQKVTKLADFSSIQPSDRWVAERLWELLDGFTPLGKLAERAGTDTYTTIKMIWDFANMGLINVNQSPLFHCSGQIGPLLVPAQELELTTWDQLTAAYLDPVSGGIGSATGNFFGAQHVINNKSLLHTVPVPPSTGAAAVFKDGKLVGLHSGPANLRGANLPPIALQRMMWIGALNDLGSKRLRTAEVNAEAPDIVEDPIADQQLSSQRLSSLRTRSTTTAEQPKPEAAEETGPLANFTKTQIAGASGVIFAIGLIMMLSSMLMPHSSAPTTAPADPQQAAKPAEPPKPSVTIPVNATPEEKAALEAEAKAKEIAERIGGFAGNLPSTFKYADTMKLTEPRESWGIISEPRNTDILFIRWPNHLPTENMEIITKRLPTLNFVHYGPPNYEGSTEHISKWVANTYDGDDFRDQTMVVGSYRPAGDPTCCIVFIARGIKNTSIPDINFPQRIIEEMLRNGDKARGKGAVAPAATTNGAAAAPEAVGELGTPQQLADYRKKLAALLKSHYKAPKAGPDGDNEVGLSFTVDETGGVSSLSLLPNPDDSFNRAIQKAMDESKPLPAPPRVKGGKYALQIHATGSDIKVDEQ